LEGPLANVVRLVLADHHLLVAEGLGLLLEAEDDLVVLELAHDSGRAVQSVAQHQPDVLVLDAHLPDVSLAETVAAAKTAAPTTKLLVLSGDAHPGMPAAVAAAGADAWLAKDRSSRQVAAVIRKLVAGEPAVAEAAEPVTIRDPSVALRVRTLTCREREILGLLASGWPSRRIAEETHLSYLTVRSHIQSLLVKLGVHSQLEAVALAVEHEVVPMPHHTLTSRPGSEPRRRA
jgi:two-component system nitrate/nitrite response regulator NarL